MKKLVYVASPYSLGDTAMNVRKAINAGDLLYESGFIPFVPHLLHFWQLITLRDYEDWMEIDEGILVRSNAVLRLEGESKGADREVKLAEELEIPVYYSMENLVRNEKCLEQ